MDRVHGQGKQLYAWTVNTQAGIRRMVELGVDNVITDNVALAKEIIYPTTWPSLGIPSPA